MCACVLSDGVGLGEGETSNLWFDKLVMVEFYNIRTYVSVWISEVTLQWF